MLVAFVSIAQAHEVFPTIIDMRQDGDTLVFEMGPEVGANLESFVAGIDLAEITDTDEANEAERYDTLRALSADEFEEVFRDFWPVMAENISVTADGVPLTLTLTDVNIPEPGDVEIIRPSTVTFGASLPAGAEAVAFEWDRSYGGVVLRQTGVDLPYDGFLTNGEGTGEIALAGGSQAGPFETFLNYIPTGFDHIVPKGLDHILFVLGLFFLSSRWSSLLWQISAFTLAHTLTLAAASLGYIVVPGSIVEPLIALSIVYVAIENIYSDGLSRTRPFVIFGFGLLHGLGFASVLAEFGLPEGTFIPALIGFNVGVEVGQLAVIAVAYLCVRGAIEHDTQGTSSRVQSLLYLATMILAIAVLIPLGETEYLEDVTPLLVAVALLLGFSACFIGAPRFGTYREMVALPGSIIIAVIAAYWTVERVWGAVMVS